jgi:hypothetical protein
MKRDDSFPTFKLIVVALWFMMWVLGIVGYVANIVVLYSASLQLDHITGSIILRIIGVFVPPLGAILGLFF